MGKKKLFKTCPKCKFDKCWSEATKCEGCGFDFKLGRKVRERKIEIDEDDDLPVLKKEEKKTTHKLCPGCGNRCWHKAHVCDKCEWNFHTNTPKVVHKVYDEEGKEITEETPKEDVKIKLGLRPIYQSFKKIEPWMIDYEPSMDLHRWSRDFLLQMRVLLEDDEVFQGCVVDWATCSLNLNEHLRAAEWQLYDWYGLKSGISSWPYRRLKNGILVQVGELLTELESAEFRRQMHSDFTNKDKKDIILNGDVIGAVYGKGKKIGSDIVLKPGLRLGELRLAKQS